MTTSGLSALQNLRALGRVDGAPFPVESYVKLLSDREARRAALRVSASLRKLADTVSPQHLLQLVADHLNPAQYLAAAADALDETRVSLDAAHSATNAVIQGDKAARQRHDAAVLRLLGSAQETALHYDSLANGVVRDHEKLIANLVTAGLEVDEARVVASVRGDAGEQVALVHREAAAAARARVARFDAYLADPFRAPRLARGSPGCGSLRGGRCAGTADPPSPLSCGGKIRSHVRIRRRPASGWPGGRLMAGPLETACQDAPARPAQAISPRAGEPTAIFNN